MRQTIFRAYKTACHYMITSIEQLKDLIIFAREQKLKQLTIGDISLEISELAHIDSTPGLDMGQSINKSVMASIGGYEETGDQSQDNEDEELLYASARP